MACVEESREIIMLIRTIHCLVEMVGYKFIVVFLGPFPSFRGCGNTARFFCPYAWQALKIIVDLILLATQLLKTGDHFLRHFMELTREDFPQ